MIKEQFFDRLKPVVTHPQPGESDLCKSCKWKIEFRRCVVDELGFIIVSLDGMIKGNVHCQACLDYEKI